MTTQFSAQIRPPVPLIDQVDILLNLADDNDDGQSDGDFDDLITPEILPKTDQDVDGRPKSSSPLNRRKPLKRPRGLAEVAAEVSDVPN